MSEALEVLPGFWKREGREILPQDVDDACGSMRVLVCGKTDGRVLPAVAESSVSGSLVCVRMRHGSYLVEVQTPPAGEWWLQILCGRRKTLQW